MDNIDSSKGLNDFLPIQDWFNEMHAKNTSPKVRAVLKNKGESGISLANNVPYGYKKDENYKELYSDDNFVVSFGQFIQLTYTRAPARNVFDVKFEVYEKQLPDITINGTTNKIKLKNAEYFGRLFNDMPMIALNSNKVDHVNIKVIIRVKASLVSLRNAGTLSDRYFLTYIIDSSNY